MKIKWTTLICINRPKHNWGSTAKFVLLVKSPQRKLFTISIDNLLIWAKFRQKFFWESGSLNLVVIFNGPHFETVKHFFKQKNCFTHLTLSLVVAWSPVSLLTSHNKRHDRVFTLSLLTSYNEPHESMPPFHCLPVKISVMIECSPLSLLTSYNNLMVMFSPLSLLTSDIISLMIACSPPSLFTSHTLDSVLSLSLYTSHNKPYDSVFSSFTAYLSHWASR